MAALAAHPARHKLLTFFATEFDGPIRVRDLASQIESDRISRSHLITELHHIHLPKLAEAEIIVYNATDCRVERRNVTKLETYLDLVGSAI